jgi:hypothetical protein
MLPKIRDERIIKKFVVRIDLKNTTVRFKKNKVQDEQKKPYFFWLKIFKNHL